MSASIALRMRAKERVSAGRRCGFEAIKQKASLITPVPGGVGPMTITMLLYNTVQSATKTLNR